MDDDYGPEAERLAETEAEVAAGTPVDKLIWKPSAMLAPVPVVLVSCQRPGEAPNLITVAWAGTVCSHPPLVAISVQPSRHSHGIIRKTGEFAINLTTRRLSRATDLCGVKSGRDTDKWRLAEVTPAAASAIKVPVVAESPVVLECQVRQTHELGSHTMFIAEIVAVQVDPRLIDKRGRLALEKARLLAFAHGHYYALGAQLGHFGFSVRKHGQGKILRPREKTSDTEE